MALTQSEKHSKARQTQCENCSNHASSVAEPCPRRLEIAAAARALIVAKGLEGLRTRDIAARAGINIATLHYHVPTKEALIMVVAESTRRDFIAQHMAHPRANMTPRQRLRQEIDDHIELIETQPELLQVMSEFAERSRRDPVVRRIYADMRQHWTTKIENIFSEGKQDGSLRQDLEPKASSKLFVSALVGGTRDNFDDKQNLKIFLNELERCFLPVSPN